MTAQAAGASVDFTVQGAFVVGGTLDGTITIDTATGVVLGATLSATLAPKFTFSRSVTGTPNYTNTDVFLISAYESVDGLSFALIGLQVPSLVNYNGGPIVNGSNIVAAMGNALPIIGGSFRLLSSTTAGGDTIATFGASGTVAERGQLGGTVTIDITKGAILSSNLTAVIVRNYPVSGNVTGTPNFGGTGLFVIGVNDPANYYPLALLGLPVADLIGYKGGPLSTASDLNVGNAQLYGLSSGSLIALTDVSARVRVTQTGFAHNRATGIWTATMSLTNTSGIPINGPLEVALTNLPPGVTMVNNTGTRNGSPYITVFSGTLGAGATVSIPIQFTNPGGGLINFTPVTEASLF